MLKISLDNELSFLYQWDKDRYIKLNEKTDNLEVHFTNDNLDNALVVKIKEKNDYFIAEIPNILLTESSDIIVYLYDLNKTIFSKKIKLLERNKPDDYIYTETEIKSYEEIEKEIKVLQNSKADNVTYKDNILYLKSGDNVLSSVEIKTSIDTDKTLTKENVPADAASVGQQLDLKATKEQLINNYYDKTNINNLISGAFHFRGIAESYIDGQIIVNGEPLTTMINGDVYQIADREYAYNGTEWVELGFNVDLKDYSTKSEINSQVEQGIATSKDYTNTALELLSNSINKDLSKTIISGDFLGFRFINLDTMSDEDILKIREEKTNNNEYTIVFSLGEPKSVFDENHQEYELQSGIYFHSTTIEDYNWVSFSYTDMYMNMFFWYSFKPELGEFICAYSLDDITTLFEDLPLQGGNSIKRFPFACYINFDPQGKTLSKLNERGKLLTVDKTLEKGDILIAFTDPHSSYVLIDLIKPNQTQGFNFKFIENKIDNPEENTIYFLPNNSIVPDFSKYASGTFSEQYTDGTTLTYQTCIITRGNDTVVKDYDWIMCLLVPNGNVNIWYSVETRKVYYAAFTYKNGDKDWKRLEVDGKTIWYDSEFWKLLGENSYDATRYSNWKTPITYTNNNLSWWNNQTIFRPISKNKTFNEYGLSLDDTQSITTYNTYLYKNDWIDLGLSNFDTFKDYSFREYAKKTDIPEIPITDIKVNDSTVVKNKVASINLKTINKESIVGSGDIELPQSPITVISLTDSNRTAKLKAGLYYIKTDGVNDHNKSIRILHSKFKENEGYFFSTILNGTFMVIQENDDDILLLYSDPIVTTDYEPYLQSISILNITFTDTGTSTGFINVVRDLKNLDTNFQIVTDLLIAPLTEPEKNKLVVTGEADEDTELNTLKTLSLGDNLQVKDEKLTTLPGKLIVNTTLQEDVEHYTFTAPTSGDLYLWLHRSNAINTGSTGILNLNLFGSTVQLGNLGSDAKNILVHIIILDDTYSLVDYSIITSTDEIGLNMERGKGSLPIPKTNNTITISTSLGNFTNGTEVKVWSKC